MKRLLVLPLTALVLFSLAGCYTRTVYIESDRDPEPRPRPEREPEPEPDTTITIEIEIVQFREPLALYGTWVEIEGYGDCWYPNEVNEDWRPYSHGHWVWLDEYGWYWVSDYEWGWACEHYGRWMYFNHRWHWVPGHEWSGGWVVWREGGGYVGWAALSPTCEWSDRDGIRHEGRHWESEIDNECWVFVEHRHFLSVKLHLVIMPRRETVVILRRCSVRGSLTVVSGRPMNRAISHDDCEQFTGKKPPRRKIKDEADHRSAERRKDDGDSVHVYRPKVKKRKPDPDPRETEKEKKEREEREKKEKADKEKADKEKADREKAEKEKKEREEREKKEKEDKEKKDQEEREKQEKEEKEKKKKDKDK